MEKNYLVIIWRGMWWTLEHFNIICCVLINYLFYRDYRPIPALDRYDGNELDEDDYDAMSPGARAAAERDLQRRDREEGAGRRDADGILYGLYCFQDNIKLTIIIENYQNYSFKGE